jgi:hypothetical protein
MTSTRRICNSDKDDLQKKRQTQQERRKYVLVVLTAVYTTFYAGAFFGYGPMQLMLEENGSFASQCDSEDSVPCPDQTSRLLNIQLVAQTSLLFSPAVGAFTDRHGAFRCSMLVAVLAWTGLTLLTIAVHRRVDNLLFCAFLMIGLTSVTAHQTMLQSGMLFDGVRRQRILSILNGLFDTGSLTYLMLWAIQKAAKAEVAIVLLLYLVCSIPVFAGPVWLWYSVLHNQPTDALLTSPPGTAEPDSIGTTTQSSNIAFSENQQESIPIDNDESHVELISCKEDPSMPVNTNTTKNKNNGEEEISEIGQEVIDAVVGDPTQDDTAQRDNDSYILIRDRSPVEQVKSRLYILTTIFFAFHGAMNNFTLTTARDQLAYLGDDETGNKYLTIFTLLTPVSIAGLPLQDYVLKHYGYYGGFQLINILSLLHGVIKVAPFTQSLELQVLGFIVFSFFRCFMFTITFSFLPTFLNLKVVGRCAGLLVFCQGITPALNIPLTQLAIKHFDGDFFYPNLFYTVGTVPIFFLVWVMGQRIKIENDQVGKRSLPSSPPDE